MFIRGSGSGIESKRNDESFYRGIVVKNNDPLKMNRVKVYIPELTNQPFEEWFEKYDELNIKIPGINTTEKDSWKDIQIFDEICKTIPWAEPCFPLMGESGNSRYFKDETLAVITDGNYTEGFEYNNTSYPTLTGSFAPSFIYENKDTMLGDAFPTPLVNYSAKCNTYSFGYKPQNFSNKTKGVVGIPEVGSKVWVFHYQGDLNFPVYFGVSQDYRSLTLINNTDNDELISNTYPNDFEN
jgi:hypothetical protein